MAHALTYDTLPAHSRLRREMVNGVLQITAAAEEPGPAVRRAALLRSAVPAGAWSALALLICFAVFGTMFQANRRGMSTELMAALEIAFFIFCAALLGLIWRAHYISRIDAATSALRQSTLLAASPGRLLIETSGPLGTASHDLHNTIRDIHPAPFSADRLLHCLQIRLADGSTLHLLPGRDDHELDWLARTLHQAVHPHETQK